MITSANRAPGGRPDPAEVRLAVEARLSPERAAHCERVAETARRLAAQHGLDQEDAVLAGLLHDWCREDPPDALLAQARALAVPLPDDPADVVGAVLHGPVAARLLPWRWRGLPSAVLTAIDRHTTGDRAMTDFDCLVYLADMLEPAHDFPEALALRELAEHDLHLACLQGLTATLTHLLARGRPIACRAILARNALLRPRGPGLPAG